jgi:hypothetical protein
MIIPPTTWLRGKERVDHPAHGEDPEQPSHAHFTGGGIDGHLGEHRAEGVPYRKFRAVTALSPVQFQKQIRLQQSRLLLRSRRDDLATVGCRVRYGSSSQFNREYRRQFGMPPGRDAARLRSDIPRLSPRRLSTPLKR